MDLKNGFVIHNCNQNNNLNDLMYKPWLSNIQTNLESHVNPHEPSVNNDNSVKKYMLRNKSVNIKTIKVPDNNNRFLSFNNLLCGCFSKHKQHKMSTRLNHDNPTAPASCNSTKTKALNKNFSTQSHNSVDGLKETFFTWSPFSRLNFFRRSKRKKKKNEITREKSSDESDSSKFSEGEGSDIVDIQVLNACSANPTVVKELCKPTKNGQLSVPFLLGTPQTSDKHKKCFIIDLDETLVHSSFKAVEKPDFQVGVEIDGTVHQVYVLKRPHCDAFLQAMSEIYECVLFTASLSKYADPVADFLDKWKVFKFRLFRESCVYYRGNYVKDLSQLGRPIDQVVILDNSPASYRFHATHAVQIISWFDDKLDNALLELIPYFQCLSKEPNVVEFLRTHPPPKNCAVVGSSDIKSISSLPRLNNTQSQSESNMITRATRPGGAPPFSPSIDTLLSNNTINNSFKYNLFSSSSFQISSKTNKQFPNTTSNLILQKKNTWSYSTSKQRTHDFLPRSNLNTLQSIKSRPLSTPISIPTNYYKTKSAKPSRPSSVRIIPVTGPTSLKTPNSSALTNSTPVVSTTLPNSNLSFS